MTEYCMRTCEGVEVPVRVQAGCWGLDGWVACADWVEPLQIRVKLQSGNKTPEEVQAIKASHRLPSRQT